MLARHEAADALAATDGNVRRFASRPDLKPPAITVLQRAHRTAGGLVFVAPSSGPGQRGAMIFDDAGELVWFHPVAHKAATDFKVGLYHGKPVLTWWEGTVVNGLADGEWVVLDSSYRELARFSAADGRRSDLHELVVTPHDTALVTSNETAVWNLASVGGNRHGQVVGGVVQELELPSGRLIWEWRSLEHVAVDETEIKGKPGPRFDYFHINSIDVAPDGNLIVSARNTWAAYKVSRRTGRILWRLGGKRSDFTLGRGARFEWQHDVREHAHGLVSLFDNAAAPQEEPQSRALILVLDTKRMHASLEHAYAHRPNRVLAHFLGSPSDTAIERARKQLYAAMDTGEVDLLLRPMRNVLSHARIKLREAGLEIATLVSLGRLGRYLSFIPWPVIEGFTVDMVEWLANGSVDVAVMYNAPNISTLITEHLIDDRLHLVGAPASLEER